MWFWIGMSLIVLASCVWVYRSARRTSTTNNDLIHTLRRRKAEYEAEIAHMERVIAELRSEDDR